jgi:hypothetical protein
VTTLKRKFGQLLFGSHTGLEKRPANPEIRVSIFYCNSTRNIGNVKPYILFVIFSPWNSLYAKNLNYKT